MRKNLLLLICLFLFAGASQAQTMMPADSIKVLEEFRLLYADRLMFFAIMDQGPLPGADSTQEVAPRRYRPWKFDAAELNYIKKEKRKELTMAWSRQTPAQDRKAIEIFTVIFAELTALRDKQQLVMMTDNKTDSIVYNVFDLKGQLIMLITVKNESVGLTMLAYG